MSNSFIARLRGGSNEIRAARVNQITVAVTAKLDNEAQKLRAERLRLSAEKEVLLDVGPDHEHSLRPASSDFNAPSFVDRVIGLNEKLQALELAEAALATTRKDILGDEAPAAPIA